MGLRQSVLDSTRSIPVFMSGRRAAHPISRFFFSPTRQGVPYPLVSEKQRKATRPYTGNVMTRPNHLGRIRSQEGPVFRISNLVAVAPKKVADLYQFIMIAATEIRGEMEAGARRELQKFFFKRLQIRAVVLVKRIAKPFDRIQVVHRTPKNIISSSINC